MIDKNSDLLEYKNGINPNIDDSSANYIFESHLNTLNNVTRTNKKDKTSLREVKTEFINIDDDFN